VSTLREEHRRLVDRYVDDFAGSDEIAELNRLLVENPEVAEYLARVGRLNSLLLEHAREVAGARAVKRASSRRRRAPSQRRRGGSERRAAGSRRGVAVSERRRGGPARVSPRRRGVWLVVAVAAAAAVLAGFFLFRRERKIAPPAWSARVASLRGNPRVYREAEAVDVKVGAKLLAGDRLLTDQGSLLALIYDDGTEIQLNRRGRLIVAESPSAKELELESGDLYVSARRQPSGYPLTVNKGRYDQVTVVGTGFEVSRSGSATVLRVAEGRAVLGSDGRVEVHGLQSSRVTRGGTPGAPTAIALAQIAAWRVNRSPVARAGGVQTPVGMPARVLLAAEDADGDHLSYVIEKQPAHGTLSGTPPDLIYEPADDYQGEDRLTFAVSDGSARSAPAEVRITVTAPNRSPVAVLEAGPGRGKAPLSVKFFAEGSKDPDGKIVSYTWEFGDGARGEGLRTEHTYARPGKFTAKLTVKDDRGATAERSFSVSVLDTNAIGAPSRLRWHYKKDTRLSYLSWRDNSDNEEGFYVERAVEVKGQAPVYERIATLGRGAKLWRLKYGRGDVGKWFHFRVRAFNAKTGRTSDPSNRVRLGYGVGKGAKGDVNWPPPGYSEK
jgi:hypothetical protein